jgi:TonB family protein
MSPPLWFANLLAYCLQVLVLVSAATALPALFRLRAPRVLLAYWQGMLLTCLILPLLQPWKSLATASSIAEGKVSITFQGASASASDAHSWLFPLIAGILLAGIVVRLGWLALGVGRLRAIRRAARALDPLPDWLRELESKLSVSPAWYLSSEMESPATFGIRPPSVLLPNRFLTLSDASQRAVAGHELMHVARRDWLFNLVEELILTVFWFHPAVAWVVNRIRLSREQAVDEEVVRNFSARKPYMNALLEIASGGAGPALGAAPTFLKERQLANRIELLVKEISMSKTRLLLSLAAIAGLLILAGVVTARAFPLRAPAEGTNGSQSAEKSNPPDAPDFIPPVKEVPPVYPPEAKKAGIEGIVRLHVTINKDGGVKDIRVLSGPPQLARAAIVAVMQWHYSPNEEARVTIVDINFTLAKTGSGQASRQAARKTEHVLVTALEPLTKVQPVYPVEAKRAGIEGEVVLRTTIAPDGSVSHLEVVSGNPLLVKPALDAVQQWRYKPSVTGTIVTSVTINFTLAKDGVTPATESSSDSPTPKFFSAHDAGVTPPVPIYKPDPPYTKEARAAKIQGTVELQIIVGVDGSVTEVKSIQGFDAGLTRNAIETVKTWKFKPAERDGRPVPWQGKVEISFKIF